MDYEALRAEWDAGFERAKAGKGMAAFHERVARAYRQVGDEAQAASAEQAAREARERFGK